MGKASIESVVSGIPPGGLKTTADYPNLIAGLQAHGYKDEAIRKIPGGNFLRVWAAIEAPQGNWK